MSTEQYTPLLSFPADAPNQAYVSVKAINTEGSTVPVFAFLIEHPTHGRALFDLGLRKNNEGYPPALDQEHMEEFKVECTEDVMDVLKEGGVGLESIQRIIYSHLHWDHVGDPSHFLNADIVLGADAKALLQDAYPKNPKAAIQGLPPTHRSVFIDFSTPSTSLIAPFGTFDRALDMYGDGSFYLVDTPGHMPGHLAALTRVGPSAFVLLAGDVCHNRQCYNPGERTVSEMNHTDIKTARETVTRLTRVEKEVVNVVIVLAHESEREGEIPFFPEALNTWVMEVIGRMRA